MSASPSKSPILRRPALQRRRWALVGSVATAAAALLVGPAVPTAAADATAAPTASAAVVQTAWRGTDPVSPVFPEAPATVPTPVVSVTVTATDRVAPGVTHTTLVTHGKAGDSQGHLITVDLDNPRVSTDLLTAESVAQRTALDDMADEAHAVAAVNGDFFNISEEASHGTVAPTNAAVGVEIRDRRLIKSAVPYAQRFGESGPRDVNNGTEVVGVDITGHPRIDRVAVQGTLRGAALAAPGEPRPGSVRIDGVNQYGYAADQIGVFTSAWGPASRARAACGSGVKRADPCTSDLAEVLIRHDRVIATSTTLGSGQLADDTIAVFGREDGAAALRRLQVGDRVQASWQARATVPFDWAIGGEVTGLHGQVLSALSTSAAPRTALGISADGRRLLLLAVDGRTAVSVGRSTQEMAALLLQLGADSTVSFDGGGSTAAAVRHPGEPQVTVVNVPSDGAVRPVANGIGVFTGH